MESPSDRSFVDGPGAAYNRRHTARALSPTSGFAARFQGLEMTKSAPTSHPSPAVKAALIQRRRELRTEIREQFADHDDPKVMALRNRLEDTDDWAVADEWAALDIAQVSRDVRELAAVESALTRIADGTYGTCIDCGEPIPAARLAVNPSAARCIACQERFEAQRAAGGPTPTL
jgi:RNA polymerase-binding protein DksA